MGKTYLFKTKKPFLSRDPRGKEYLFQFILAQTEDAWIIIYGYLFDVDSREFTGCFTPKHADPEIDAFMALAVKELLGITPINTPSLDSYPDDDIRAILPLDF